MYILRDSNFGILHLACYKVGSESSDKWRDKGPLYLAENKCGNCGYNATSRGYDPTYNWYRCPLCSCLKLPDFDFMGYCNAYPRSTQWGMKTTQTNFKRRQIDDT